MRSKSDDPRLSGPAPGGAEPPVYAVAQPATTTTGFVYNTPHSGTYYPPDLLHATRLPLATLRSSEDCLVDRLFAAAPQVGAPLLMVNYARAYVDSNREPLELDPALFDGPLPSEANSRSERVRAGLGTIPTVVAGSQRIYTRRLPVEEGLARIAKVHQPIHAALGALMGQARHKFGYAVLIDCHSMPSGRTFGRLGPRQLGDIVLGDCHGASCSPLLTEAAAEFLRDCGYRVILNMPYSGGYNTHHYGRPSYGMHALQIEINRALYVDETRFTPTAGFTSLARDLRQWMERLHRLAADCFIPSARSPLLRHSAE